MTFDHVNYLWDEEKAANLGNDHVALFLFRSNILGADLRITNYGGGNTSSKTIKKNSLTNEEVEVRWIKESGRDIGIFSALFQVVFGSKKLFKGGILWVIALYLQ